MNHLTIFFLLASLAQAGAIKAGLRIPQAGHYGWSESAKGALPTITFSSGTGEVRDWDKDVFPNKPTCTVKDAEAAMKAIDCDSRVDRACYQKQYEAMVKVCGGVVR